MTGEAKKLLQTLTCQDPEKCLRAETVVEAAISQESPLHPYFEWDDTKAGHQYRLEQARKLIAMVVVENPGALLPTTQRAYISLVQDRIKPGGGYRLVEEVVRDPKLLQQIEDTALHELHQWGKRYLKNLPELVAQVWDAAGIEEEVKVIAK